MPCLAQGQEMIALLMIISLCYFPSCVPRRQRGCQAASCGSWIILVMCCVMSCLQDLLAPKHCRLKEPDDLTPTNQVASVTDSRLQTASKLQQGLQHTTASSINTSSINTTTLHQHMYILQLSGGHTQRP